jgi:NhaA family Na+:H+ antiporter
MGASSGSSAWWEKETTPGYLLLAATALSFVLLNAPATAAGFKGLLNHPIDLNLFGASLIDSKVSSMVKDALMAVFFLYVGLELKREVVEGPFRNAREAALPALGAVGGMAAPALIYLFIAAGAHPDASSDYVRGWAIPSATDIAFAVGVLSLLGSRVPPGLRLFLLALAIADDLGAILVIAIFYSTDVSALLLGIAAAIVAVMIVMNRLKIYALTPYWIAGLIMWFVMKESGVSPTLAGVLTAVTIPMRRPDGRSPLVAAEHALKPWVQLGIMPVFALAVAGVPLAGVTLDAFLHPITLGIALGLFLGKPIGIVLLTWLGSKALKQPTPGTVPQMIGVAMVAGIGFTMSLFVGALAFTAEDLQAPVRFGVLGGSTLSAIFGLIVLSLTLPKSDAKALSPSLAACEKTAEDEGLLDKR